MMSESNGEIVLVPWNVTDAEIFVANIRNMVYTTDEKDKMLRALADMLEECLNKWRKMHPKLVEHFPKPNVGIL